MIPFHHLPCNEIIDPAVEEIIPDPLPDLIVTEFIAWLMKRGYIWPKKKCEIKCSQIGLDLDRDVLDPLCPEKIIVGRTSGGDILVKIVDKSWAQQVTDYHDRTLPHHSFPTSLP